MTKGKVTWNDLHEATQSEIRSTYKMDIDKQGNKKLEKDIRRHLDGANSKERREFYNQFYSRKENK